MSAIPDSSLPGHKQLKERVESALDLCQETRDIEYKSSAPWKDLELQITRTSMAMSNLRDGGIMIIGVREDAGEWDRTGICEEHLGTYDEDIVNDAVNKYASPPMRVELVRVPCNGVQFLAIRVSEFDVFPTICARDGPQDSGLRSGVVFVRPPGKPQTTAVRTLDDIRGILELAAEKRAREMLGVAGRIGMQLPAPAAEAYERELEGL